MLFTLNKSNGEMLSLERPDRINLASIGLKEEHLQKLIYSNMHNIFPDDNLLLIMQSRKWQEEPDLMALDSNGNLYIFELKAWESKDYNLLQVLRYGQIYGQYSYEDLNKLFRKFNPEADLLKVLNDKFNTTLNSEQINKTQRFVVITNGLDHRTRESIIYWRDNQGVKIAPWIYRLYNVDNKVLIDFDTFSPTDSSYEDVNEGYYVLNTNIKSDPEDDADMLNNGKASAFFEPWKYKIELIRKGDKVFLYRSGAGIVAIGLGSGKVDKLPYKGSSNPEYAEQEYSQKLMGFKILTNPLLASDIKKITDSNHVFMQTLFSLSKDAGDKLWGYINKNCMET